MEDFRITAVSASSLTLSWSHPRIVGHHITSYNLTCVPLLSGIPVPQSLWLPPTTTSATVTGLRPGVLYNCTIFTITDQGSSPPLTLSLITSETGIIILLVKSNHVHAYFKLKVYFVCRHMYNNREINREGITIIIITLPSLFCVRKYIPNIKNECAS